MNYEIHVTVKGVEDIPAFKLACGGIGVKPIIIDLVTYQDVMTSSHFVGDDDSVVKEVERISSSLEEKGYNVIRKKVEVPPYHCKVREEFGEDNYLEAHLPIEVLSPLYLERLKEVAFTVGAHVSKNAFKPNIYLVTYRSKEALEDFYKSLAWVIRSLYKENFVLAGSYQVEFALFDSCVGHDGWADKMKDETCINDLKKSKLHPAYEAVKKVLLASFPKNFPGKVDLGYVSIVTRTGEVYILKDRDGCTLFEGTLEECITELLKRYW